MIGKRFGLWTVISKGKTKSFDRFVKSKNSMKKFTLPYWWCKCDCGAEREVAGDNLRKGRSRSCGCAGSVIIDNIQFGSYLEAATYLDLKSRNEVFLHNKLYPKMGLKRYDFYIPSTNTYIETSSYDQSFNRWSEYLCKIDKKRAHVEGVLKANFLFVNRKTTREEMEKIWQVCSLSGKHRHLPVLKLKVVNWTALDWTLSDDDLAVIAGRSLHTIIGKRRKLAYDTISRVDKNGKAVRGTRLIGGDNISLKDVDWTTSNGAIGRLKGVSSAVIAYHRKKLGHPSFKVPPRNTDVVDESRPEVVDWKTVDWSKSNHSLARIHHRSRCSVRQARKRWGVPIPQ